MSDPTRKTGKGTITINGNRQTEQTATETSSSETSIQETGNSEATLDEAVKEQTSQKTDTGNGSKLNAFAFGAAFALLAVIALGIYFARRK